MGFNTVVLICNDGYHDMRNDPDRFFDDLLEGFTQGKTAFGSYLKVLPSEHADVGQLVFIQGNAITPIATVQGNDPIYAVEQAARRYGVRL